MYSIPSVRFELVGDLLVQKSESKHYPEENLLSILLFLYDTFFMVTVTHLVTYDYTADPLTRYIRFSLKKFMVIRNS